ncbi:MAG TPA: phage tail sheath subtilisin-like domain-containing protein [Arachnia sp.]|nr:phage tail sheath subtilisin-like domain-containing protein [Arachnia sp.]
MPSELAYPGVYIEELPSGVRTITGVATSIAGFVGWAGQGPTDEARRLTTWEDFVRTYGGLDSRSHLSYAVRQYFDNGGRQAYVVRLAADGAAVAKVTIGGLELTASGPGTWAESYGVLATPRGDAGGHFSLTFFRNAAPAGREVVEVFQNLSLDPADPRFVEFVVNEESRIVNADVGQAGTVPDTGGGVTMLDDGEDGDPLDPVGATQAFWAKAYPDTKDGGVFLLDRIDLFNLLCVPGLSDPDALQKLAAHCKARRAFLIADAPESSDPKSVAPVGGLEGTNAALYFPWLRMSDPLQEGRIRAFPPSGAVAGIYARTDATRGVWKAPAGTEATITGARALTRTLTDAESGVVNKKGVNALRTFDVYGQVVWGARTCQGNDEIGSEWKYVPVRRTALFLEETLYRSLKWVVFEPNDEPLWSQIRLNVGAFMHDQFRKGAFQGSTPRDAYFVKCDRDTTTQNDVNLGIVNIVVGYAPLKPAEFVVIRLQQLAGQLQA